MIDSRALLEQPIGYLRKTLDSLDREPSPRSIAENARFIAALAEPTTLAPLLRRIVAHPAFVREVAARSYRHVNHFDKFVLVGNDRQDGYRLTLHLWDPPYSEREQADELIHDHRFDFWSAIVTGTLTSDNFEESQQAGQTYRKYQYTPEQRGLTFHDFYRFCGETRLSRKEQTVMQRGESYKMIGPRIHQVLLPRRTMTCTLVLRGPRLRSYANVYNTAYPKDNTTFDNSMFPAEHLVGKLSKLVYAIQSPRG